METSPNDEKIYNKGVNSDAKSRLFHKLSNSSSSYYKKIGIIILFTIICLVIMMGTVIVLTSNKPPLLTFPPETSSDPPSTTVKPNGLIRIYSRKEWSAVPPKPGIINPDLKLPVEIVIIAHSADGENCTTTEKCLQYVRNLQKFSMTNPCQPFNDIPYNFVVGGDGNAYEGRGWFKKGAHSGDKYNNRSIAIGFAGTFTDVEPPQQQLRIAQLLIEEGVYQGHLSPMYKVYGACQVVPKSESPGKALYDIISKWPHWEKIE